MTTINDDDKVIEIQIRLKSYAKEIQQIIADYRGEIEERCESLIQSMHRTNAESLDTLDARIRAEARAEALKESAKMARSAILGFGKPQAASDRYSPMIRKDLAAQLAEHAILADEPKELECSTCGRKESAPYDEGDSCYCGGKFLAGEPKEERGAANQIAVACYICGGSGATVIVKGFYMRSIRCPRCNGSGIEPERRIEEARR